MANEIMERSSSMEEAFDASRTPVTMPAGPQQITIENRPNGAQKVAVYRQKGVVLRELKTLAAAAGDGFYYRWPVKSKDKRTGQEKIEYVEGPSVKCTNAVAREYGNCFVQVTALDNGTHWMINARFLDLETGFALERPFQQRKNQNVGGGMDKDRAMDIVFQIGVSKATRNVVANALSEFVDFAFEEAKAGIVQKVGKNLERYRQNVNQRLQELEVPVDRVEKMIGKTIDKWLAPDVARVIAEIQSVNDGMADPEEMWPPAEFGQARPTEDEMPAKDINQDKQAAQTQQAAQQAQPKKEEPKAAAATQAATAEAEKPDEIRDQVTAAIASAATADGPTLEAIDDQTSSLCDRAGREDQRSRWNEAYVTRKAEIRRGHTGPSALAPQQAQAQPDARDELLAWFEDQKKDLAKTKNIPDLDALEEKVAHELTGDQQLADEWKNLCNAKARELMGKRGR